MNPPSTNFLDVIQNVIDAISNLSVSLGDLSNLLSVNFDIGDISQCVPTGLQLPNLQLPQFGGVLNCFQALPNLSGIFGSMASCVGNVMANFPSLSGFLSNLDLGNLMSCLQNQLPSGNISVNIPDLLGDIMGQIEAIQDSLSGVQFDLPRLRELLEWSAELCQSIQVGGGTGGGFPMSGASYATSSSTASGSTTVGFQFQAPPPPPAGARVAAAAIGGLGVKSVSVTVTSRKKILTMMTASGDRKKVPLMKSLSLKRRGTQAFTGKIDYRKLKLPPGSDTYAIMEMLNSGKPVMVGGGDFQVEKRGR